MNRPFLSLFLLCLWPGLVFAQAQEGLGLDLTADPPKPEESKTEEAAPTEDESSAPAAEVSEASTPLETGPADKQLITPAEREITQEDRVKSVQRKVYLKKHRFEISPFVGLSVNDPYYSKATFSLKGAFYLADTLALAARFSLLQVVPLDDVRVAKTVFYSRIFYSVPSWSAMGDVEWSPLYGKVAFLNSILHFDSYLIGGLGVVNTDTSALADVGFHPAADLGIGFRFVARDFLAVNVALINTTYVDTPVGTPKGAVQNIMTINAGISLFLPLRSTGREAE